MSVGRIIRENKTNYILADAGTEYTAVVRGKFHVSEEGFPKVGDYVEYLLVADTEAVIERVVPRRTQIVRMAAGDTGEHQVIVANVDVLFVVMGLDDDFNLKRLERYIVLAEQSKVAPVIVLNKCDATSQATELLLQVQSRFKSVPVYMVSAKTGVGMDALLTHIGEDTTAVLLGSSGAGKSTITNWLMQEATQRTQGVRVDDGRGRHTTTARQLFTLPSGGFLIDTPGMRELALVAETSEDTFTDIDELALGCKFRDCDHAKSAGCMIQAALIDGSLSQERYESYCKLGRGKAFADSREDLQAARQQGRKMQAKHIQVQQQKFGRR